MTCGEKIKLKRKELGLSQTDLANKVGLKFGTISKYEKDEISIPSNTLKLIADVLNISTDYLLGATSMENPKEYLEKTLSNYELTETEYDLTVTELINTRTFNLDLLNSTNENMSKLSKVYKEIFNIYMNYIETNSLENEINDFEKMKNINASVDEKFIEMLKSLDKNKIIKKEESNVFPVIDKPKQYPILGKISAGLPILAVENIEGYTYIPSSKIQKGYDYFFLRVQGDSMNLKFPNGCLLFIQRQPELENGQIGVFRVNGDDATVKRFKRENGFIILEPMSSNPEHQVQIYDPQKINIEIIGKVISFIGDVN